MFIAHQDIGEFRVFFFLTYDTTRFVDLEFCRGNKFYGEKTEEVSTELFQNFNHCTGDFWSLGSGWESPKGYVEFL